MADVTLLERIRATGSIVGSEAEQILAAVDADLSAWRRWAQLVYLGGGPVTKTDDELRAGVCAAHDAQVDAAAQTEAVDGDVFCASCGCQMRSGDPELAPPRADALAAPRTATVVETGTQQAGRIVTLTVEDAPVTARLRERMRIQRLTDARDPDYAKRTRQLLLQLDEYPDHTECLIVAFADLDTLLRAAALDAAPRKVNEPS